MNGGINEVPGVEVKSMKLSYFIYTFSMAISLRQADAEAEGMLGWEK